MIWDGPDCSNAIIMGAQRVAETINLVVRDMDHIVHFVIRSTKRMGLVFAAFGKRAKWGRALQIDPLSNPR
jgi:hypothetical protein